MNSLACVLMVAAAFVPPTKEGANAARDSAGKAALSAINLQEGSKKLYDGQTGRIAISYAKYLSVKANLNETDAFFLGLSFTKLDTQVTSSGGYIEAGNGCLSSGTEYVEAAAKAYDDQKWGDAINAYNSAFAEYENAQGNYTNANEAISDDLITLVELTLKGY